MENQGTRLNKYLSEVGYCSRREADRLIEEGRITVNGELPELGLKVTDKDIIKVNGKLIRQTDEDFVYLAFNKPVGIECTTNTKVKENIVDFINYSKRIFPVGRLDKDSEGLIIMTNDGDIVNKILRQKNNHEKEYIVTVNKPITDRFIQRMGKGVPILDTVTKECRVERISNYVFRIFLTQGLNRQIRRMTEYFGYDVVALKRIRIINITLDVPVGTYRKISPSELAELNQLIAPSLKTEEASLEGGEQKAKPIFNNNVPSKEDRKPKRNFEREKTHSKKVGPQLRNERISRRREQ